MDKAAIIRNFSRYACLYDRYADAQRRSASTLLDGIQEDSFRNILEIGCGTGNYTLELIERFGKAKLKALDISEKMIGVAQEKLKDKEVEFIVADAENVELNEKFDLISSNACFQWLEDLRGALLKYNSMLSEPGAILFSIFGPLTFYELGESLKSILKDASVSAENFMAKDELAELLGGAFREIRINEARYEESFSCLRDLLDKIKYTGARGEGINGKLPITERIFKELEQAYLNKFSYTEGGRKRLRATYQVFFCFGRKL